VTDRYVILPPDELLHKWLPMNPVPLLQSLHINYLWLIASRRAMRSSMGGGYLKSFRIPPPVNGIDNKHVRRCRVRVHGYFL